MQALMAAMAHWTAATELAPPIGVTAEKRRSAMPKLVMKSSATVDPEMMMPSISLGVMPASVMAANDASSCSASTLFPEAREYAVSPMPVMAPFSLRDIDALLLFVAP